MKTGPWWKFWSRHSAAGYWVIRSSDMGSSKYLEFSGLDLSGDGLNLVDNPSEATKIKPEQVEAMARSLVEKGFKVEAIFIVE